MLQLPSVLEVELERVVESLGTDQEELLLALIGAGDKLDVPAE